MMLSFDRAFWSVCSSKARVLSVMDAVQETIQNLETQLQFSAAEGVALRRVLTRWLGPGVAVVRRIRHAPALVLYVTLGMCSPLLLPHVRWALGRLAALWRRVTTPFIGLCH